MGNRSAAASLVLSLALFAGCKSSSSSAAAQSGGGPVSAKAPVETQSSIPTSTMTATINDPSFNNMPAETLTIPAGWKLDGIMLGTPCNAVPWPVFRAYASDGITEMRAQPVLGWRWNANPKAVVNTNGCLPLTGQMNAAQFLQYYLGTIQGGVHVVGTMPISARFQQIAQNYADQMNAGNARLQPALQANNTADTAAIRIQTVNGSFVIEQRIRVQMECATGSTPMDQGAGKCFARVDTLRAPLGKLDALVALVDDNALPKATAIPQWAQAYMQRQQQQARQMMAALTRQEQQENNMLNQQFQQIMQKSAAEHAAFMQQQESSFQSAMNNANASMNAQSTAASDWVDYALDQQTVTGAGGTAKVSSAYSQTWSNGQGQWYQTNDPNSNPNGMLSGTWTQDTKVHGNGQPMQ